MCTNGAGAPADLIRVGLAALLDEDVTALPDQTVRAQVRELVCVANQVQAALSARVASFDVRGLSEQDGLRTTRNWLSAMCRLGPHAASGLLRRSLVLRQLPALAAAAAGGEVSAEHVAKVADLVEQIGLGPVQHVDAVLADLAMVSTPAQLQQACERVRAHIDPDGPQPDPAIDRRGLTISPFGDMVRLRGQLDPEAGALLLTALNAVSQPAGADDERTPAQRRADALTELARLPLQTGQLPTVGGFRPQIGLLVTPAVLAGQPGAFLHSGPPAGADDDPLTSVGIPPLPEPPWLDWVGPVPVETAQRLACDSVLFRLVYDPASGQPLDVGRGHRTAPAWIRKALHARDQGCRWPGCEAGVQWTDAHHRTPWAEGGLTKVDEMLLLCRWHHTRVHEGQWRLDFNAATGEVSVTRPDGTPYELGPSQPWLRPYHYAA